MKKKKKKKREREKQKPMRKGQQRQRKTDEKEVREGFNKFTADGWTDRRSLL